MVKLHIESHGRTPNHYYKGEEFSKWVEQIIIKRYDYPATAYIIGQGPNQRCSFDLWLVSFCPFQNIGSCYVDYEEPIIFYSKSKKEALSYAKRLMRKPKTMADILHYMAQMVKRGELDIDVAHYLSGMITFRDYITANVFEWLAGHVLLDTPIKNLTYYVDDYGPCRENALKEFLCTLTKKEIKQFNEE